EVAILSNCTRILDAQPRWSKMGSANFVGKFPPSPRADGSAEIDRAQRRFQRFGNYSKSPVSPGFGGGTSAARSFCQNIRFPVTSPNRWPHSRQYFCSPLSK